MGHEFDHYPKQMLHDIRNWDWFLEEPKRESDDDKELVAKLRKVDRPKYSTRSKDCDKPHKETKGSKNFLQKKTRGANEDDDETLGGFIVEEDDVEQEEETDEDEEEFVEDDDEEEVDD